MMKRMRWAAVAVAVGMAFGANGAAWKGVTSNPRNACFAKGTPVVVTLSATGLVANATHTLEIGIYDEFDKLLTTLPGTTVKADAAGAWKRDITMPAMDYGFYRVRPRVDGALVLPQEGSMPAGGLTYAVLHDPATRPLYPQDDTFFGLHGSSAGQEPWMGARMGLGMQRGNKGCATYEDFRKKYDAGEIAWKQYGLLNVNLQHRMMGANSSYHKYLPPEALAFAKTNKQMWAWFDTPERERWLATAWENMARENAGRDFGRAHGFVTRYYESQWEPELTTPSRDLIVRAAKISYEAIHRGDPEAVVIGPTLSTAGTTATLRELFEKGLGKYIDAYCVHNYAECPPEPNDFVSNVRATKALVRSYMKPGAKLCGTENGCGRLATLKGETEQLQGVLRQQLILLGEGFAFNCAFYGYDFGEDCRANYGFCYNLMAPKHAWAPERIAPRPSFVALSAASWFLEGHRPTCVIEWLGETTLGYAYQSRAGHCVVALWDWGGNAPEVEIPVGRESVVVGDAMGKERTVATPGGKLKLTLSGMPQYVLDVSPEIWGREAQAKLKWSERKFVDPKKAAAPLHVEGIRPAVANGELGVAVTVANTADAPREGVVETRIHGRPEARREVAVALAAHETREVVVAFDGFQADPFACHEVQARVTPKGEGAAQAHEAKAKLNFFPVMPRKAGEPLKFLDVPQNVVLNADVYKGADDVKAKMAAAWAKDGLILAFEVEDDDFCQEKRNWGTWDGDSIQVGLAKDKDVRGTANAYADDLNRALSEMTLALTKDGPAAYRTMTWEPTRCPAGGPAEGAKGAIAADDMPLKVTKEELGGGRVRVRYAACVPWRFLNVGEPEAGMTVNFAATVNDRDAGRRDQVRLGVFELKNGTPRQFGTLVLGE